MKSFSNLFLSSIVIWYAGTVNAQTNVGGGIYSDTTWTLANSPYVVISNVVVFPGVTLTIEPGVIVRFNDSLSLEIRQATLIAMGTGTDSITFTSNSNNPFAGIYAGVALTTPVSIQMEYCNFKFAATAIAGSFPPFVTSVQHLAFYDNYSCMDSPPLLIRHLFFYHNTSCIGLFAADQNIDSCTFINNTNAAVLLSNGYTANSLFLGNETGVLINDGGSSPHLIKNCIFCNNTTALYDYNITNYSDSIVNCNFSQNHIGFTGPFGYIAGNIFTNNDTALIIYFASTADSFTNNYIYHNQVGVMLGSGNGNLVNNHICNNSVYNLLFTQSSNTVFQNTCWCDTDSATIASKIYDGNTNISLGLVNFIPFVNCDSSVLSFIPPINCQNVVMVTNEEVNSSLPDKTLSEIYPDPSSQYITLNLNRNLIHPTVKIMNALGEVKYISSIQNQTTTIDISFLSTGIYFIEETDGDNVFRQKFIKE